MHGPPMPRNRRPITHPDVVMPLDVVEHPFERTNPSGAPDDPPMQPDGHHPRTTFPTAPVQPVERLNTISTKLITAGEIAAALQTAVIAVKRVRNDELKTIPNRCPVRQ